LNIDFRIIGITDRRYCGYPIIKSIIKAVKGGIKTIQIREKDISDIDYYKEALEVSRLKKNMDLSIFINDRYDIAQVASCDGVHLGSEDLPLFAVRKHFKGCIGKTVKSKEEAIKAEEEGADYIAIGPFYHSNTKPQKIILRKSILQEIRKILRIPIIAIGGITPDNAPELLNLGADGIAVSESLFNGDVSKNAKNLVNVVYKYGCN
jgi:thiamine-phosphate pyrophosphorylase